MVGVARGHQRADTLKPYSQKTSQSNHTRTTALSNSMKLSHACGATQDGQVIVGRSDRMRSTGEGNGKPFQYSCLENSMNSMKRQKDRILKSYLAILNSSVPYLEYRESFIFNSFQKTRSICMLSFICNIEKYIRRV